MIESNFSFLSERLKWARERKEQRNGVTYSWAEVGRRAGGVSGAAVANWLNDTNGIAAVNARPLAEWLDVDALWLETGEGSPERRPRRSPPSGDFDLATPPVSTDQALVDLELERVARLLALYRASTEKGRRFILSAAEAAEKSSPASNSGDATGN